MKRCVVCKSKLVLNKTVSKLGYNFWECSGANLLDLEEVFVKPPGKGEPFNNKVCHYSTIIKSKFKKYKDYNYNWSRIIVFPYILVSIDPISKKDIDVSIYKIESSKNLKYSKLISAHSIFKTNLLTTINIKDYIENQFLLE